MDDIKQLEEYAKICQVTWGKKKTDEEYIIDARDVYFSYDRNSGEVLRGLNLKVKKGEWYCLMGGNGAGKSRQAQRGQ